MSTFKEIIFNIFGSKSSTDWDVMVVVDDMPESIDDCHKLVEHHNDQLVKVLSDNGYHEKKINSNLCVIKDGSVKSVFKGTHEEVNNSMMDTYHHHKQIHPLLVNSRVERDIDLKVLRCFRIVLSFLSRSKYRKEVKKALNGTLESKIAVLKEIDFSQEIDLGNRNVKMDNFYKILVFQLGQTISLVEGTETYTKEDINDYFDCKLANPLYRKSLMSDDLLYANELKNRLIQIVEETKTHLLLLNENSIVNTK